VKIVSEAGRRRVEDRFSTAAVSERVLDEYAA
jgi:hypothetical protein